MSEQKQSEKLQWLGQELDYSCLLGLAWAWEQGPRLRELGMSRHEHQVLMALAAHTDYRENTGESYPSQGSIAAETGLSKRRVVYALRNLVESGVIWMKKRSGKNANQYCIQPEVGGRTWVRCTACTSAPRALVHGVHNNSAPGAPQMVHGVHHNSAPRAPEYVQEEVQEEVKEDVHPTTQQASRVEASQVTTGAIPPAPTRVTFGGAPTSAPPPVPKVSSTPTPVNFPDSPASRVAEKLWATLGSPRRERHAAQTAWVGRLQPIVERDGGADLLSTVTAALKLPYYGEGDAEHEPQLPRLSGDTLEYVLCNMDKIADDVDRFARAAARKAAARTSSTDEPTTDSDAEWRGMTPMMRRMEQQMIGGLHTEEWKGRNVHENDPAKAAKGAIQ